MPDAYASMCSCPHALMSCSDKLVLHPDVLAHRHAHARHTYALARSCPGVFMPQRTRACPMAPCSPVSSEPLSPSSLSPPQQKCIVPANAVQGLRRLPLWKTCLTFCEDEDGTMMTSVARRTRRRGALIPEDMWDWAYKKKLMSCSVSAHGQHHRRR